MRAALVIALSGLVSACATNGRPPVESAAHQLHRSVAQAKGASTPRDALLVTVRFNPVEECECPEFELHLYGAWTRAYLEGGTESLTRLRAADPLSQSAVTAERTGERRAPNGVEYAVWAIP